MPRPGSPLRRNRPFLALLTLSAALGAGCGADVMEEEAAREGEPEGSEVGAPPGCDPLLQDCPAGFGCYPSSERSFECVLLPEDLELGGLGDPCAIATECGPGFTCMFREIVPGCSEGFGCCNAFCDATDEIGCAGWGLSCEPLFEDEPVYPTIADLGLCAR